jgi:hypothetical protein
MRYAITSKRLKGISNGDSESNPALVGELMMLAIAGQTATLNHHLIESAMVQLPGQFATGTLTAKVMMPRP